MRERIHNEWRVEFALEGGHRQWDISRWGIAAQVLNAPVYGLTYLLRAPHAGETAQPGDNNRVCDLYSSDPNAVRIKVRDGHYEPHNVLYPIPQKERDLNKKLTQNPGYPQ